VSRLKPLLVVLGALISLDLTACALQAPAFGRTSVAPPPEHSHMAASRPPEPNVLPSPYDWFGPTLLPDHRIVAYYGNPESEAMGILGFHPTGAMIARLDAQASRYQELDPTLPVLRALDMVTVVASGSPQPNGTYSIIMSPGTIQKELDLARAHRMLLILDLQVGRGTVRSDVRALEPFLVQPDVELALDPEFDMNSEPGGIPGHVIGSMKPGEINWTLHFLNGLVVRDHLPQKILVVHQFVDSMVPDWQDITPVDHVALVRDQDGVAHDAQEEQLKVQNYEEFVRDEPIWCTAAVEPKPPFTPPVPPTGAQIEAWLRERGHVQVCGGFKVFYTRDIHPMDPEEVMSLDPPPLVVIYQ